MNVAEKLANDAVTTLASSCTSSATTISVTSAAAFPSTGNFRLNIDSELLLCTAVSGTTFTVVRGVEGSTAASHSGGASVNQVLTVAAIQSYLTDAVHNYSLPSRPSVGRLLDSSGNTLTSSDFTVTAAGTSSVSDVGGCVNVVYPALSGGGFDFCTMLRSAPATPYSIQCALQTSYFGANSGAWWYGLCISDGTKLVTHGHYYTNTNEIELSTSKMNTTASESADYLSAECLCDGVYRWLKIVDDGTDFTFYFSHDGVAFNQTYQVSRTDWLSSVASVGLFCTTVGTAPSSPATVNGVLSVCHYSENT